MTANFVPARVPLVDPRTGLITREWFLLFQGLFSMGGGISDDLIGLVSPVWDGGDTINTAIARLRDEEGVAPLPSFAAPAPGTDDLTPPMPPLFIPLDDVLPVIGALRDEIAALRARIDDMAKGGPVL